jgi:peroxiredoxin
VQDEGSTICSDGIIRLVALLTNRIPTLTNHLNDMNETQISESAKRILTTMLILCVAGLLPASAATPPKKGDPAPNFTLKTLDDKSVELHELTAKSRVVLVVLRGWPGYQCPVCERQVQDLMRHASQLKERGVQMLFVYPGPVTQLKAHAREFIQNKDWPSDFLFVTDPDYAFTISYGLRWNAPNETAYPSTFIIDREAKVEFAQVSKEHGGRVDSKELLKHL